MGRRYSINLSTWIEFDYLEHSEKGISWDISIIVIGVVFCVLNCISHIFNVIGG